MENILPFQVPVPDEDGYLFYVPPREPWKKFWYEHDIDKKYIPADDTPLFFRKVR